MIEIEIEKDVYLPVYQKILDCEDDIILLWGGRDSGKSYYIASRLIEKCLSADYFRCVLVRKTFESIKDSQWQTIKDIVTDWGLESLFKFTESPLAIKCVNGNKFIARGCDKPGKNKSLKDPTDAWYEEGNQLTEEDYTTISTTLRANDVKTQEWLSFNPEHHGSLEDFWIYKYFFKDADKGALNFSRTKNIEFKKDGEFVSIPITYTSCHTTYRDNPFCTGGRIAKLEELKVTNPYFYEVFTNGLWGTRQIINPLFTAYDPVKHESEDAVFVPGRQITFTVDFNLDPFSIIMQHIWRDVAGNLHFHIFDEMALKQGNIPKLCDELNLKYGNWKHLWRFTGDAMGKRREIGQRDHASAYMQIQRSLKLSKNQFFLPSNPTHENSRDDSNYFLYHFPDFKINPKTCPNMCRDMKVVQCDEYGSIIKQDRSKIEQLSDFADCFRYSVNTFMKKQWIIPHQKMYKTPPVIANPPFDPEKNKFPTLDYRISR